MTQDRGWFQGLRNPLPSMRNPFLGERDRLNVDDQGGAEEVRDLAVKGGRQSEGWRVGRTAGAGGRHDVLKDTVVAGSSARQMRRVAFGGPKARWTTD